MNDMKLLELPQNVDFDELKATIGSGFVLQTMPVQNVVWSFYDSFDGALLAKDCMLMLESIGRTQRFVHWMDAEQSEKFDYFADDLPSAANAWKGKAFSKKISKSLGIRALLPQITLKVQIQPVRVLNQDGKTLAWLNHLQFSPAARGPALTRPLALVRLQALRGFEKETRQVLRLAVENLHVQPLTSLLVAYLAQYIDSPWPFNSRLDFHFHADANVAEVGQQIFTRLLQAIEANKEGTVRDLDIEFLHDLRVATRRTRSALGEFKPLFSSDLLEKQKQDFRWIQQITGETRDMDVYLQKFPGYENRLSADWKIYLHPLKELLQQRRALAQRQLARHLRSARFREVLQNWHDILQSGQLYETEIAKMPAVEYAHSVIYKRYRKTRKEGKPIKADSEAEVFHELRKSLKKLRYSMEFFRPLLANDDFDALLSRLKTALDDFGDFQDYEVQVHKLRDFAQELYEKQHVPVDVLLAIGQLMDSLQQQHVKQKSDCVQQLEWLCSKKTSLAFKQCFSCANESD
ncbi:MAG: CHAD domain-containing protein [gamma proteobacterium symbiont of Bathyaustriella thionipta]|nr:CHAD domain-containing protein [gamma proteobacterium symbiont of Bathyaustriella thionipta]